MLPSFWFNLPKRWFYRMLAISSSFQESGQIVDSLPDGGQNGSAVPQQRACQDGIEIDGIYIKCVSAEDAYKVLKLLRDGPIYPTFNFDALALLKKAEEGEGEDNDNSHKPPSIPNVRLLEIRSLERLLKNSDFHKPIYDSLQGNTSKNIYILTEHSDTVSPFRQICFKISFQDDRSIKFNIVYYFFSGNRPSSADDIFLIIGPKDDKDRVMSCGYDFATEIFKPTAPR
ncbi:MAG: hypothetical protein JNL76_02205 [Alphaproteobacteria bacterium]|nr:hypothetical protein [Alphaproteobacteria bacterium]